MKDYLELGQIVNTKGLKGEVKLNSFAEDNMVFETLKNVYLKDKQELLEKQIEKVRLSQKPSYFEVERLRFYWGGRKITRYVFVG